MSRVGKIIFFFIVLTLYFENSYAQTCTGLGQNPTTAFPVCGTNVFTQTSVPVCGGTKLPTQCTDGNVYTDVNPYWYKFTCYVTGTFGFVITPKNLGDDYDWQLFDITGRNPMDIYTDKSLIVSANWSGSSGITGASPAGKNVFECASIPSQGISTFSVMPTIIAGHDYLLLVSHFDGATQSGYTLSFPVGSQGGTASIVNPVVPSVTNAFAVCDGTEIILKLNKKVNCSSLASDGSDFLINGPVPISIVSASGNSCSSGFDMDSITLKLNRILSPGTYTVSSKLGTDGNTLLDNCNNSLATGVLGSLKFTPSQPTPMDSISPVVCITNTLQLVFSKPMNCNSIASDGSDFSITGPATVTVKSASGVCTNGVTTTILITLTKPIRVNGTFTISLKVGTDGNTLIDECAQVTPAGSTLSFTTKNITTADFTGTVAGGCKYDTLYLTHNGYGGTTQWQWGIDSNQVSTIQNPTFLSKGFGFGPHTIQLNVYNGFCSDTAFGNFTFTDYTVKAAFTSADTLCPTDTLHFTDMSSGSASSWKWDFGNGTTSFQQVPGPQSYPANQRRTNFLTSLIAGNSIGCTDTTYKYITVLASCYIAVPSAFTPNGDGLNDYLYPLNAFNADNMIFRVFNRYGQIIFESKNWTKKWDGRVNGNPQPSGTYVWTFSYTDHATGQPVFLKGTSVLIR